MWATRARLLESFPCWCHYHIVSHDMRAHENTKWGSAKGAPLSQGCQTLVYDLRDRAAPVRWNNARRLPSALPWMDKVSARARAHARSKQREQNGRTWDGYRLSGGESSARRARRAPLLHRLVAAALARARGPSDHK